MNIIQRPMPSHCAPITDNPLFNRIFNARGVKSSDEINYSLQGLLRPHTLKNLTAALNILTIARQEQKKILILGDFDTDGASSTALALLALADLGYTNTHYLIPDRFSQGYGLSLTIAQEIIKRNIDLVITVDNGISSCDGVALLRSHNIEVIITDHHLPPEILPNAHALINPNLNDCTFSSKNLAGVGVIFYVMAALRSHLISVQAVENPPNFAKYLDLVALGTIADVVPLDTNNRILVHNGLKRIRQGGARAGIYALFDVAGKNASKANNNDLGFSIVPRLNAAGRLDNMALGVELLLAKTPHQARSLAYELDHLNQMRRSLENEMKEEAFAICNQMHEQLAEHGCGIVLYQHDWHQGILGIIASRIKDRFHQATIAFANEDETGEFLKGSARSIAGLHIKDVLERIDSKHPQLIERFGGHAMAAGLTLQAKNLEKFTALFNQTMSEFLGSHKMSNTIETDGSLPSPQISLKTAEQIEHFGPWGQNFPRPLFDDIFTIVQQKIVGTHHLKLLLEKDHQLFDAMYFNVDLKQFPDLSIKKAHCVYQLEINEFRGITNVQLIITYLNPL